MDFRRPCVVYIYIETCKRWKIRELSSFGYFRHFHVFTTISKFEVISTTMLMVHVYFIIFIKINEMLKTLTGRIIHFCKMKHKRMFICKLTLNDGLVVVMIWTFKFLMYMSLGMYVCMFMCVHTYFFVEFSLFHSEKLPSTCVLLIEHYHRSSVINLVKCESKLIPCIHTYRDGGYGVDIKYTKRPGNIGSWNEQKNEINKWRKTQQSRME